VPSPDEFAKDSCAPETVSLAAPASRACSSMVDKWLECALGIVAWYLTSFGTLLLNKYLLGSIHIQPNTLAVVQMVSTAIYGALKTLNFRHIIQDILGFLHEGGLKKRRLKAVEMNGIDKHNGDLEDPEEDSKEAKKWRRALMQIGFVGVMRFATVVLGLVSLKHIAASFTETVKASAPFFTVVIAYLMIGEKTSPKVMLSLIPVGGGLAMVSITELSFNVIGFAAAVATNVIECVQNVFSKRLLAVDYTPTELQFYTSLTALVLQAPILVWQRSGDSTSPVPINPSNNSSAIDDAGSFELTHRTVALLWIDGVLYHLQSVVAYVVMSHLSPVTVSVINTLKRALLIWISVLVFGNTVTLWAKAGTVICLGGTLSYNYLRSQVSK